MRVKMKATTTNILHMGLAAFFKGRPERPSFRYAESLVRVTAKVDETFFRNLPNLIYWDLLFHRYLKEGLRLLSSSNIRINENM